MNFISCEFIENGEFYEAYSLLVHQCLITTPLALVTTDYPPPPVKIPNRFLTEMHKSRILILINTYVKEGGRVALNISSQLRKEVIAAVEIDENFHPLVLRKVWLEVCGMLFRNTLPRFVLMLNLSDKEKAESKKEGQE